MKVMVTMYFHNGIMCFCMRELLEHILICMLIWTEK